MATSDVEQETTTRLAGEQQHCQERSSSYQTTNNNDDVVVVVTNEDHSDIISTSISDSFTDGDATRTIIKVKDNVTVPAKNSSLGATKRNWFSSFNFRSNNAADEQKQQIADNGLGEEGKEDEEEEKDCQSDQQRLQEESSWHSVVSGSRWLSTRTTFSSRELNTKIGEDENDNNCSSDVATTSTTSDEVGGDDDDEEELRSTSIGEPSTTSNSDDLTAETVVNNTEDSSSTSWNRRPFSAISQRWFSSSSSPSSTSAEDVKKDDDDKEEKECTNNNLSTKEEGLYSRIDEVIQNRQRSSILMARKNKKTSYTEVMWRLFSPVPYNQEELGEDDETTSLNSQFSNWRKEDRENHRKEIEKRRKSSNDTKTLEELYQEQKTKEEQRAAALDRYWYKPLQMLRQATVAVTGGALVVIGIPLIAVPIPGPGVAMVCGGLYVLGSEFEACGQALEPTKEWIIRVNQETYRLVTGGMPSSSDTNTSLNTDATATSPTGSGENGNRTIVTSSSSGDNIETCATVAFDENNGCDIEGR